MKPDVADDAVKSRTAAEAASVPPAIAPAKTAAARTPGLVKTRTWIP
jgi:hypothetical protein